MELFTAAMQEMAETVAESALSDFSPDDLVESGAMKDTQYTSPELGGYDPDELVDSPEDGIELDSKESEDYDPDDQVGSIDEGANSLSEVSPGHRVYLDDSNKVYRVDDELLPNNEYVINGYEYKTDEFGRITSAEGQVSLRTRERLPIKDSMDTIGKGSQRETDDRGHLMADWFNGSNGMENIVPMDGELNKGAFNKLENRLAEAVKNGCDVSYKVEPRYSDDSRRPSSFVVTDIIDGETTVTVFKNEGTATRA